MAIYRTVQLSFWTDNKVVDDFTPEDKYFYLYLFTNPQTNLCGCYEVSLTTMSHQTGYNKETILRLLERFENVHKVIKYSANTKEIFIRNWHRYNWQGGNQIPCIKKEIGNIKDAELKRNVMNIFIAKYEKDKPLISPLEANCLQATVTVTDTVTVSNTVNNTVTDSVKEVIDYFNKKLGTKYTYKNKSNVQAIKGRLEEGHTVDECKKVIDIKYDEWINDKEFRKYLTIETLFRPSKFEKYLNQQEGEMNGRNNQTEVRKHEYGISL